MSNETTAGQDALPTYAERIEQLSPEEHQAYMLSGNLPEEVGDVAPVEAPGAPRASPNETAAEPDDAREDWGDAPQNWFVDAARAHPDMPMSLVVADQILNYRRDGHVILEYLATHPSEAQELVEQSGLGIENWDHYANVIEAAKWNPEVTAHLVRAHDKAEAILDRISKEVRKQDRLAQTIRTGDFEAYSKLENRRALAEAQNGYSSPASGSIHESIKNNDFERYEALANAEAVAARNPRRRR